MVEIVCHFLIEEKLNMAGCIVLLHNVLPFDSVICRFVWDCF